VLGKVHYNGGKMENLESLLNFIIKQLVETEDKVNITYEVLDSDVTFKVSVAKEKWEK
jgi:RNA-binding protein